MTNVFKAIAANVAIEEAIRTSKRNDLLPPREEDTVGGELASSFGASLRDRMERSQYEPTRAAIVTVPKSQNSTRPASLLTVEDRIVYEALVAELRPRIDQHLLRSELVLWPRGVPSGKRWASFQEAPLKRGVAYVVLADIGAFYECVGHERLRNILVQATGKRDVVAALIEFLERTMGRSRGLPQGLSASDPLATVYLQPLDAAMAQANSRYTRHGDDIRIGVSTYAEGRRALHQLESCARALELNLNAEKSIVMKRETYAARDSAHSKSVESAKKSLLAKQLAEMSEVELDAILTQHGEEHLGWALFYHGDATFDDVVEQLVDKMKPSEVDVGALLLDDAMSRQAGHTDDALPREEFHARLMYSLTRLSAGDDPRGLVHCALLLRKYPEKADAVCGYLSALAGKHGAKIAAVVEKALGPPGAFRTPWELAWYFRALESCTAHISPKLRSRIGRMAQDENTDWLARAAACRVLGSCLRLSPETAYRVWTMAPIQMRPDVIVAVWRMRAKPWAKTFLAGLTDSTSQVLLRRLDESAKTRSPRKPAARIIATGKSSKKKRTKSS